MPQLTVVIPTYNEGNIIYDSLLKLENFLFDAGLDFEILLIDDNSPDNTISEIERVQEHRDDIRYIVRNDERDLVKSVVLGMKNSRGDIIVVTDADLSHEIEKIPEVYNEIKENKYDVVIGSRYEKGSKYEGWTMDRRAISLVSNTIAHVLFPHISDFGGFFGVKKEVIEDIPDNFRGNKPLLEIIDKGRYTTIKQIPYLYSVEKLPTPVSFNQITEFLLQVIGILLNAIIYRSTKSWEEIQKVVKFTIVGIAGIFIDVFILFFLTDIVNIYYMLSGVIGTELSLLANFGLNDKWSFIGEKAHSFKDRIIMFHKISFGGIVIKMVALYIFTSVFGIYYILSSIMGLGMAYGWNMMMNRRHTWS